MEFPQVFPWSEIVEGIRDIVLKPPFNKKHPTQIAPQAKKEKKRPNSEKIFENIKKPRPNSEKIIDLISRAKREENFEVFLRLKTAILSKISTF